jgi:hypothetical protein
MGKFARFLGRLLIVITLFLFAYDKYKHPTLFAKDYRVMLTQLGKYTSYVGYTLPPVLILLISSNHFYIKSFLVPDYLMLS